MSPTSGILCQYISYRTIAFHAVVIIRTGELKLLQMGQVVFLRLFFHHMAGNLQGHDDFKTRLFTYLDGKF